MKLPSLPGRSSFSRSGDGTPRPSSSVPSGEVRPDLRTGGEAGDSPADQDASSSSSGSSSSSSSSSSHADLPNPSMADVADRYSASGGSAAIPEAFARETKESSRESKEQAVEIPEAAAVQLTEREFSAAVGSAIRGIREWAKSFERNTAMQGVAADMLRQLHEQAQQRGNDAIVVPYPRKSWIHRGLLSMLVTERHGKGEAGASLPPLLPPPFRIHYKMPNGSVQPAQVDAAENPVRAVSPEVIQQVNEYATNYSQNIRRMSSKEQVDLRALDVMTARLVQDLGFLSETEDGRRDCLFAAAAVLYQRGFFEALDQLMKHLPHAWHDLFNHDNWIMQNFVSRTDFIGFVERNPVEAAVIPSKLTPSLENQVDVFIGQFKTMDDASRRAAAQAIFKEIDRQTIWKTHQEALIDAVRQCMLTVSSAPKDQKDPATKDLTALVFFASSLTGDAQARFLPELMQDERYRQVTSLIEKLLPANVAGAATVTTDKEFEQKKKAIRAVATLVDKLPDQTRMMACNQMNQQLQRFAGANPTRADKFLELKFRPA